MKNKEFNVVNTRKDCNVCHTNIYAKVIERYDESLDVEYTCDCGTCIGHVPEYTDEEFDLLKKTQEETISNLGNIFKRIGKTNPGKMSIINKETGENKDITFDTIEVNNVYKSITKDDVKIMVKISKDGEEEFETIKFKNKLKHYRNIIEKKNSIFTDYMDIIIQR